VTQPDPVVPTPAAQCSALRGRRVIVGIPGVGFRGDLRADSSIVQAGRTFVPVLTEQDFYRSEIEQIEVFASLVPVDRVWVEEIRHSALGESPALDAPPVRRARRPSAGDTLLGRRIIRAVADGFVRDLRALSDLYRAGTELYVRVCTEAEWYAWAMTGRAPESVEVSALDLWVD